MILTFAFYGQSHTYNFCDFYCFSCFLALKLIFVDCIFLVLINQQHTIRSANCLVVILFFQEDSWIGGADYYFGFF